MKITIQRFERIIAKSLKKQKDFTQKIGKEWTETMFYSNIKYVIRRKKTKANLNGIYLHYSMH